MRREDIISKGYYTHPQVNGLISVKQFIVLRQENEKRLLLRMSNDQGETVTGFSLRVLQYDAAGRMIGSATVEKSGLKHKARSAFHVGQEIPLEEDCVDFRVTVLSVQCGSYLHKVKGEEVLTSYLPEEEAEEPFNEARILRKMNGERHRISSRTYRPKLSLILICSVIVLTALIAAAVHLAIFMSTETLFTLDHVDYRFETDNHESGPICIVGYRGSARNLVIPEQVEGHRVTRIAEGSFSKSSIRTLVIEGETVIDNNAFSNCHTLESVSMERVPMVGAFAFSNCSKLETVSMGAPNSVIGNFAFMSCSSLENVSLPSSMESIGNSVFAHCSSLKSLTVPTQLSTMGEGLLYDCSSLRALSIPTVNLEKGKGNGMDAFFTSGGVLQKPKSPFSLTLTNETTIADRTFYECDFLSSITVRGQVKFVGDSAFYRCKNLKEVHLPDGVVYLGEHAFNQCESLSVLEMGTGLKTIREFALANCRSLRNLELPDDLKSIERNAFQNCSSLQSLRVPSTVTQMGINLLQGCSSLTDLTLPYLGLTEGESAGLATFMLPNGCSLHRLTVLRGDQVEAQAFAHYSSIREIKLPDSVVSIGENAFLGCTDLQTVNFPRALTSVGSYAFKDCSSLGSATISDMVTHFGDGVFEGCSSLQTASLPARITTIPPNTFFQCESLESVAIPKDVTVIEPSAFEGCRSLKQVVLPSGLSELGDYAFSGCSSLSQVTIPSGVTALREGVFADCTSLVDIMLPDGLERIEHFAFRGTGIKHASISTNVTYIGQGVFEDCKAVQSLTVPYIGNGVFAPNTLDYLFNSQPSTSNRNVPASLTSVTVLNGSQLASNAFYNCRYLTDITLPASLSSIPNSMFYGCSSLKSLTIPQSVNVIGAYAFQGCKALREIALPDELESIGNQAFSGCASLQEITVPPSVTRIGSSVFAGCSGLKSMTLPFLGASREEINNLQYVVGTPSANLKTVALTEGTQLCASAFSGCKYLTTVILPGTLIKIDNQAFYNCSSMREIVLPDGLTEIGARAFYGCSALEDVTVPDSVLSIGSRAFDRCTKLKSITLPFVGSSRESSNSFAYIFSQVPETLTTVTLTDCTRIPSSAFKGCSNLTSITLPDGLEQIGQQAFSDCSSLTSMTVPTSVTVMGNFLFRNCYGIEELSLPFLPQANGAYYGYSSIYVMFETFNPTALRRVILTNTGEIRNRAFADFNDLEEVVFETPITSIGEYAFLNCYSLKEIELPESLGMVGEGAFEGCYRMYVVRNHSDLTFDNSHGWDETYLSSCALTILEDGADPITVKKNGFVFLLGDEGHWYLVDYTGRETKLSLPESFRYNQADVTSYVIPRFVFRNNQSITELQLSSAVSRIGMQAFANCENLRLVTIPHSMQDIEYDAFWNCMKLEEVYNFSTLNISAGSTEHGSVAYYALVVHTSDEEEPLTEVMVDGLLFKKSGDQWFLVGYEGSKTKLTLNSFIYEGKTISSYRIMPNAFLDCDALTSVVIGRAVTEIGNSAFASCDQLRSVTFAANSRLTSLPSGVFMYCPNLTTVVLPSTLMTIGEWCFESCHSLTEIVIPKRVELIGNYAFYQCMSLTSVTFESDSALREIGFGSFYHCEKLKELVLPQGLTEIRGEAFANCSALEFVSLPGTLMYIDDRAFSECRAILEVVNLSTLTITAGSSNYGEVALYAIVVHGPQSERLPKKTITEQNDTYHFVYYNNSWCLYAIEADPGASYSKVMILPTWMEGDKTVSYRIIHNGLHSVRTNLVIPAAVISMDMDSKDTLSSNTSKVYYGGTEQQWNELMAGAYSGTVLYYADCVHDDTSWTYVNGMISTSIPQRITAVTKDPTCQEMGVITHTCSSCSQSWTEFQEIIAHAMDDNYECSMCHKAATKVTLSTIASLSGFQNDTYNPFSIDEEGVIMTGPVARSTSTMQMVADRNMTISLQCKVEGGARLDRWQFYINGRLQTTAYGDVSGTTDIHLELKEGDTLMIRYRNTGGNTTVSGTGIIQNFYIL